MVRPILLTLLLALVFANVVIGAAPEGWLCTASYYNEGAGGSCDCGCGVYDPDCNLPSVFGRAQDQVAAIFCKGNRQDQRNRLFTQCSSTAQCNAVPLEWTCEPRWYNEISTGAAGSYGYAGAICHCGCGTYDPDCAVEVAAPLPGAEHRVEALPMFCNSAEATDVPEQALPPAASADGSFVCSPETATCQAVPAGWFCPARYYNELEVGTFPGAPAPACHCACGVYDPDCDANFQGVDLDVYCVSHIDVTTPATDYTCQKRSNTCTFVPSGWKCPKRWYAEYLTGSYGTDGLIDCDCGCGIYDPDCDVSAGYSPLNPSATEIQQKTVPQVNVYCSIVDDVPTNYVSCNKKANECSPVPVGWRCPPRWYDESTTEAVGPDGLVDCDCGCGAFDPDCKGVAESDTRVFCSPLENADKDVNSCLAYPVKFNGKFEFQGLCLSSGASLSLSFLLLCVVAMLSLF